jgi:hypothetical protein
MFKTKFRPHGMEFAACSSCNNGTAAADLVASFMARLGQGDDPAHWRILEAKDRLEMLEIKAPGILLELFRPDKSAQIWLPSRAGLLTRKTKMEADGPLLRSYLNVFASKFGMALYREHIGQPLPLDGAVQSYWFLNAGLAQATVDALLKTMPLGATLQQGRFNVDEQFSYRFNSDDRSIVAALTRFHSGLYTFTISAAEPERYQFSEKEGATAAVIHPGGLIQRMPPRIGKIS